MKRYGFLTLIFLAMVMAILIASREPAPAAASGSNAVDLAPEAQGVSPAQVSSSPERLEAAVVSPTANPTSTPGDVIPVSGAAQAPAKLEGEVTADVLNVRVGPGLNHRIMRQLVAGQRVTLIGRSTSGDWLAVRLADGKEGWVYGSYLRHSVDLAALPVREAYGGPLTSAPEAQPTARPSGRYTLNVAIGYNQAEVTMAGFAAERNVTLRLVAPGEGLAMTVATTTTDAQGKANVIFDMPATWPDGSAVTQRQMELQVLGADGKLMGKARIAYQASW